MTLDGALKALAAMQATLPGVIRTYPYPPSRREALTDFPCWTNTYSFAESLGWGALRVERYTITSQLFIRNANQNAAAAEATAIGSAYLKAWDELDNPLGGETVGTDMRTVQPTLGMIEWAGQSYVGCQFLMAIDVSCPTDYPYEDQLLDAFNVWSAAKFPTWQMDPRTWKPSNAEPALYWHYVELPHWSEFYTLSASFFEATVAARVAAPSRPAWQMRTAELSMALGRSGGWIPSVCFGSVELLSTDAWPAVNGTAEGQLQVTCRFVVNDDPEDEPYTGWPWTAILTYTDTDGTVGPSISVTSAGPPEEPAPFTPL